MIPKVFEIGRSLEGELPSSSQIPEGVRVILRVLLKIVKICAVSLCLLPCVVDDFAFQARIYTRSCCLMVWSLEECVGLWLSMVLIRTMSGRFLVQASTELQGSGSALYKVLKQLGADSSGVRTRRC